MFALTITVGVSARPDGDFATLAHGRPGIPPAGCSKKEERKTNRKCIEWDRLHTEFTNVVTPRIVVAVTGAETALNLVGHIEARVKSTLHLRPKYDDLHHYTFTFTAGKCDGECTGHAYPAGAPRHAKIWDSKHELLYELSFPPK